MKETLSRGILNMHVHELLLEKFGLFFDTLNDQDKWLVKTAKSNRTFCFGDGVDVKAIKAVKFPVTLGGIKGGRDYTKTDIIKNVLPQLLSHKPMKTAGMQLNFKNYNGWILGRYIKLQRTVSGHHSLLLTNILLGAEKSPKIVFHYEALEKCFKMEKRKEAENFHQQFALESKERLISLA